MKSFLNVCGFERLLYYQLLNSVFWIFPSHLLMNSQQTSTKVYPRMCISVFDICSQLIKQYSFILWWCALGIWHTGVLGLTSTVGQSRVFFIPLGGIFCCNTNWVGKNSYLLSFGKILWYINTHQNWFALLLKLLINNICQLKVKTLTHSFSSLLQYVAFP